MAAAVFRPVHYPQKGDLSPQAPDNTMQPKKITLDKALGTVGYGLVITNSSAVADLRLSFAGGDPYLRIPPNTVVKFDARFNYFFVQSNSAAAIDWSSIVMQG
jgi:hypothetical protein